MAGFICVKGSRAFLNHTTGGLVRDESVVCVWDVSVCVGWVEYVNLWVLIS